jgi:regulatory protein
MPPRARQPLDSDGLWNYALRLLSGRALTIGQLKEKLAARAAQPADIEETLSRLKELHILNDRKFADSFSVSRRDGANLGRARVLRELAARKVPRKVAEDAVTQAYQDVDESAHAEAFLRRKLRVADPAAHLADPKHLQSAFRKLRYNGFSTDASLKALRRFSSRAAGLEFFEETELDAD